MLVGAGLQGSSVSTLCSTAHLTFGSGQLQLFEEWQGVHNALRSRFQLEVSQFQDLQMRGQGCEEVLRDCK